MTEPSAAALVDLLTVELIDNDHYRGARQPGGIGRVFGGQVLAQALQAAQITVDPTKAAHSLHANFIRPGDETLPIDYRVIRDFDGRSFSTRRVVALQRERPILTLTVSFQVQEAGLHHQDMMPEVPPPDALAPPDLSAIDPARLPPILRRRLPIEFRPVVPSTMEDAQTTLPRQQRWFRLRAPIGDDSAMHRAMLAYASDFALIGTALLPHGLWFTTPGLQVASLDHALWFHEPFRIDEWLLYDSDSPWAGHGRGLARGRFFTADGRLVASVAQEGLIRQRA